MTEYTASSFTATIPALSDTANIVNAFEDYHDDIAAGVAVLARTNTFTANQTFNGSTLFFQDSGTTRGRLNGSAYFNGLLLQVGTSSADTSAALTINRTDSLTTNIANVYVYSNNTRLYGTLTLNGGTTTLAPLKLTAGTSLTTPVYGAVEASTDTIYLTNNPGSTSTGPGRGVVLAPQMVFSLANSSTSSSGSATSIFAAANDVLSVLEANKLYRFRAKYYSSFTYAGSAGAISIIFAFSNAPTAIKYSYKTYPQTASFATSMTSFGTYSVTTASPIMASQSSSGSWVTEIDGYFTTHATLTSTLTPQFSQNAVSSTGTMTAGSWFEVEKLGTATTTSIAGNWA